MRTTKVTMPDGSVVKAESKSSCGCLTFLAAMFVIGAPGAFLPLPLAIAVYVVMGIVAVAGGASWISGKVGRKTPPPAVGTIDPAKVLRTPDGKWVSADGTHYYPAATATWANPVAPSPPPPPTPA